MNPSLKEHVQRQSDIPRYLTIAQEIECRNVNTNEVISYRDFYNSRYLFITGHDWSNPELKGGKLTIYFDEYDEEGKRKLDDELAATECLEGKKRIVNYQFCQYHNVFGSYGVERFMESKPGISPALIDALTDYIKEPPYEIPFYAVRYSDDSWTIEKYPDFCYTDYFLQQSWMDIRFNVINSDTGFVSQLAQRRDKHVTGINANDVTLADILYIETAEASHFSGRPTSNVDLRTIKPMDSRPLRRHIQDRGYYTGDSPNKLTATDLDALKQTIIYKDQFGLKIYVDLEEKDICHIYLPKDYPYDIDLSFCNP